MNSNIRKMYSSAFKSTRSGALYNAFSYPTKISPEVIAVFIAAHTKPGETVLDPFGGSGTTALAAILCANPTPEVIKIAKEFEVDVVWGKRDVVLYEISTLGTLISKVMTNPPEPKKFIKEAEKLLSKTKKDIGWMYEAKDLEGNIGQIRHIIWSDVFICSNCGEEVSYWDSSVSTDPLEIKKDFCCTNCNAVLPMKDVERVLEDYYDPVVKKTLKQKKKRPQRVYGQTGSKKWVRDIQAEDNKLLKKIEEMIPEHFIPKEKIEWGDLYRAGYHEGVIYAHQFYTRRNLLVMSTLWGNIKHAPSEFQDSLKLLVLSYNSSHSTLMTRVVKKKKEKDFVLTGAQPGVLYISNLPVEKNILVGVARKIKTFFNAFLITYNSNSRVKIINSSSTNMKELQSNSIAYIFTDPPFADFIPYSEVNYLNEIWLGEVTEKSEEAIISTHQNKGINEYEQLMMDVFSEMSRVLKANKYATVVFHSAKSSVWDSLSKAYSDSGFTLSTSSILDKVQGSYKQVNSSNSVSGDPLLLLEKGVKSIGEAKVFEPREVVKEIVIKRGKIKKEHLYSYFVNFYLENNSSVPLDAKDFYKLLENFYTGD